MFLTDDHHQELRCKESPRPLIIPEGHDKIAPSETKKESNGTKRPSEQQIDPESESKKFKGSSISMEDNLSEISDDPDEILNMDEDLVGPLKKEQETSDAKEDTIESDHPKSESPKLLSIKKEESIDEENGIELDFEEISEDELEEEARVKGLGDALGVDWASLVTESRPRVKPMTSVKKRWEGHNMLVNLGISVEMAGVDLVTSILKEHSEAKLSEEAEVETKTKLSTAGANGTKQIGNECENISGENKAKGINVDVSHPIAAIQVAIRENEAERKMLFSSVGPYRRALSARRDLAIRRHLCNLPLKDAFVEAPKRYNPELFEMAVKLFEECA